MSLIERLSECPIYWCHTGNPIFFCCFCLSTSLKGEWSTLGLVSFWSANCEVLLDLKWPFSPPYTLEDTHVYKRAKKSMVTLLFREDSHPHYVGKEDFPIKEIAPRQHWWHWHSLPNNTWGTTSAWRSRTNIIRLLAKLSKSFSTCLD